MSVYHCTPSSASVRVCPYLLPSARVVRPARRDTARHRQRWRPDVMSVLRSHIDDVTPAFWAHSRPPARPAGRPPDRSAAGRAIARTCELVSDGVGFGRLGGVVRRGAAIKRTCVTENLFSSAAAICRYGGRTTADAHRASLGDGGPSDALRQMRTVSCWRPGRQIEYRLLISCVCRVSS